jgi:hypothetical protein
MNIKSAILIFPFVLLNVIACSPKMTCQSLHVGTFKNISKKYGTTIITRTEDFQVEENSDMGYKLTYDIKWISDCSYELRLKEVIKGDPSLMNERKYVVTVRIMQIKGNSYISESSSTYSDKINTYETLIIK